MNINDVQSVSRNILSVKKPLESRSSDKNTDLIHSPDMVEISDEAKAHKGADDETISKQILEALKSDVPDVRVDKIRDAKNKVLNGDFNRPEVIENLAIQLKKVLGF